MKTPRTKSLTEALLVRIRTDEDFSATYREATERLTAEVYLDCTLGRDTR